MGDVGLYHLLILPAKHDALIASVDWKSWVGCLPRKSESGCERYAMSLHVTSRKMLQSDTTGWGWLSYRPKDCLNLLCVLKKVNSDGSRVECLVFCGSASGANTVVIESLGYNTAILSEGTSIRFCLPIKLSRIIVRFSARCSLKMAS
jgi:hypothetical protein